MKPVPVYNEAQRRVMRQAAALSSLPENSPVWVALLEVVEDSREQAEEVALAHETNEEKRAGYCARVLALKELVRDLNELRTGRWKTWAVMRGVEEAGAVQESES